MDMSNQYVTSRTHAQDYLNCKRYRYWRTLYRQTGIEPVRSSIPLVIGSSVHAGIETILNHIVNGHCQGDCTGSIDFAVEIGLNYYKEECARREIDISSDEDPNFVAQEQLALIEAILRGWCLFILPQLLAEYHVVGIEREDTFKLDDVICDHCQGMGVAYDYKKDTMNCPECAGVGHHELWWQSRADIDLQSKRTGELYVASIKNLKEWKRIQEIRSAIDMQGHSETYAAEQARQTPYAGIQMIINVKGQYKKPWSSDDQVESGPRTYQSFLVHPWMKEAPIVGEPEFAWTDKYQCVEPHKMANGKKCEGGKGHKLTAAMGWRKVNIWELEGFVSIKQWIQMLMDGKAQGGPNPLGTIMLLPVPHSRNKSQIDSWLRQVRAQEIKVAQDGEAVNSLQEGSEEYRDALDAFFPLNTEHCLKFSESYKCEFFSCCHEGISEPLDSGLYQIRRPHHEMEKQIFREKGIAI